MVDSVPMKFAFGSRTRAASAVAIVISLAAGAAGFAGCRTDADPPGDPKKTPSPGATSATPAADTAPAVRPWVPRPIVARRGRKPVTSGEVKAPALVATGGRDSAGPAPTLGRPAASKKRRDAVTPADSAHRPGQGPAPPPRTLLATPPLS